MAGPGSLGRFLHLGVVRKLLKILPRCAQGLRPRAFKDTTCIPAWTAHSVQYNSGTSGCAPNPDPITHKACLQRKMGSRLFCLGRGLQYPHRPFLVQMSWGCREGGIPPGVLPPGKEALLKAARFLSQRDVQEEATKPGWARDLWKPSWPLYAGSVWGGVDLNLAFASAGLERAVSKPWSGLWMVGGG